MPFLKFYIAWILLNEKRIFFSFIRLQCIYSESESIFKNEAGFNIAMLSSYDGRLFACRLKNYSEKHPRNMYVCWTIKKNGIISLKHRNWE